MEELKMTEMRIDIIDSLATMAEAFCKWDDEKTGLNPFLPQYPRSKGVGNTIMKYVLGTLLFVVRCVPVLVLVCLLLVAELLSYLMIGNVLRRVYWSCVVSPICNLLLLVLGVWPVKISYGESQKLRIRTEVDSQSISLSCIRGSDIIISNFVGYLQILVYGALKSDRFGFVNKDGMVIECGLLTAMKYAMWPIPSFLEKPGRPLQDLVGSIPLILFSEDLPTNNRAILQFASLNEESYASFAKQIHLFSMMMDAYGTYLVGGSIHHFLSLLTHMRIPVHLTWICDRDLALLPPPTVEVAAVKPKLGFQITHLSEKNTRTSEMKQVETIVDAVKCNKYYYEVKYPELLAAMMQTKVVSLTKSQGFEFIAYYNSRGNKKQD